MITHNPNTVILALNSRNTALETSSQIINTQTFFAYPDNFTDVEIAVAPLLTEKQRSVIIY